MSKQFSVIGCQHGHISVFISEMLAEGYTCVGIYESGDPKLAKTIAERYNVPLVADPEALLGPSVEIVGTSATNNEKIDIIELCEKHGKHIMVDKPLVTSREGLERLEAVIERGKIQVGLLLTERYRPATATLKRKIQEGVFGDIVSISMRKPHKLTPANRPQWHFSKQQNGGIVIDLFVHDFDLARWFTEQEVKSTQTLVTKNILPEYPDFYDTATSQVLMDQGTILQLYADWHTPEKSWTWGDCRIFIDGTNGCAELRLSGDPAISEKDELFFQITHDSPFIRAELDEVPANIMQDFLNRIAGKESLLTHKDLLATSRASIEADEGAVVVRNI